MLFVSNSRLAMHPPPSSSPYGRLNPSMVASTAMNFFTHDIPRMMHFLFVRVRLRSRTIEAEACSCTRECKQRKPRSRGHKHLAKQEFSTVDLPFRAQAHINHQEQEDEGPSQGLPWGHCFCWFCRMQTVLPAQPKAV